MTRERTVPGKHVPPGAVPLLARKLSRRVSGRSRWPIAGRPVRVIAPSCVCQPGRERGAPTGVVRTMRDESGLGAERSVLRTQREDGEGPERLEGVEPLRGG